MMAAKPVVLDEITQDHELLVAIKLLELDHNIQVVEYETLLGDGHPGMALEWRDLEMPAIVVRLEDYSTKEMCLRAMLRAWEVSREMTVQLRTASINAVMQEAKGQTKQ